MNSDNFNTQVCRICLQSHTKLMLIFDSNAVQMLHECNFCEVCKVSKDDGLPNQICATCFTTLEECYTFKKLCKKSDTILKEQLINRTSKNWQEEINLFVNKIREDTISQDSSLNGLKYDITESNVNKEEEHIQNLSDSEKYSSKENLISFLEKPLPPPLPFQCQHCTQSFNEENDLQIHQSVHNSDLMCVTCSKKFTGRQSLKRHLKIHLIQKPHTCKICNKSFPESYDLVKHLRRHSGIPRDKRHFCEVCGQGFSEPYYLKIHVRKHTGERPFECQNCHKRFADPRSFKTHSMIHAGSKPFKCNFCLKNFIQSANLTKHMRIHTGEKPYVCKICDKKFSQSSSLERHFRSHTGKNTSVMTKH